MASASVPVKRARPDSLQVSKFAYYPDCIASHLGEVAPNCITAIFYPSDFSLREASC